MASRKPTDREPMLFCPNCSKELIRRGCKLICACGYFMSCSDYV